MSSDDPAHRPGDAPADLPTATPSTVGLDATGVVDLLDALDAAGDTELHSLVVLRHGRVAARTWWAPYEPADATLLYSLSKSFTATAFGFALAEGLLSVADRVVDHVPPRGPVGPRTAALTLGHLAAMATGHHEDTLERVRAVAPDDPAQGLLTLEPESEPGTVFAYNNPATYTLAAVVQAVTGQTLTDYLTPRLFEPLGVVPGHWDQHPPGRDVGFTGLHLTTDALARFGQLYLDDGTYGGRRVLPEGWAGEALALRTPNPGEPNPDWQQGYGYQFWRGRHGTVRADGAYGQFVVLLPEQDAVLVTTGGTANLQGVLDAVWEHLLPAFDRVGPADADARLAQRSRGLELVTDRPDPLVDVVDERIRVAGLEEDGDGWTLVLVEDGQELRVGAARSGWRRTDLAVAPGWGVRTAAHGRADDDGVVVDVVLVETPHRLRARVSGSGATLTWHTAPLWRLSVRGLATPR